MGMKVMVFMNMSTEVNLANGSRGIITDIILDKIEVISNDNLTSIQLQYPPAVVLFKPFGSCTNKIPGLLDGIVPIFLTF